MSLSHAHFEDQNIRVTNSRIESGGATIPLDSILSVRVEARTSSKPSKNNIDARWMCIFFFVLSWLAYSNITNDDGQREAGALVFAIMFLGAGIGVMFFGKYSKTITTLHGYSVSVITASEKYNLLQTNDRAKAEQLKQLIADLISNK